MTLNDAPPSTRANERFYRAASALLVSLMMMCAVLTFMQFIRQAFGPWNPRFLPVVVFLLSLERFYLHPTYKQASRRQRSRSLSLLIYWIALLLLLKLVTTLSHGWRALVTEIPAWQEDFLTNFFTLEYLAVLVVCFFAWLISGIYAELFDEMGLDQALLEREYGVTRSEHEQPPRERLQGLFFTIGAFLVVLTALSRIDIRAILALQPGDHIFALPWLAGGGFSTLLYFMFGFALLSLTKFINLYIRWRLEGVPVSHKIAGRWAWYSLILLAILALMVSLLPTHYSLGFISILHQLLSLLVAFIVFITGVLWTLLMLPFMALLSLFGSAPSDNLPTPAPDPVTPSLPQPAAMTSLPGWELIKPYLFWILFLIVAVYAIRYYLLQHEALLHTMQNAPLARWLRQLRQWLATLFRTINYQIIFLVGEGVERFRAAGLKPQFKSKGRFISLNKLNPRQQIHFYYHALLRRSSESKLPRAESQTPAEYAVVLKQNLPDSAHEIDIMTREFIRARYTQQEISKGDVGLVRQQWQRIRKELRLRSDRKQ